MKKYVVKRCPAKCMSSKTMNKCWWTNYKEYCQDKNTCVIKQIIELCKKDKNIKLTENILNLLEIEEVNE